MEWATASSVLRVSRQAYDHRHLIQKYWKRALAYLDRGATNIVVTGHSGVGKSMLVAQLHGRARELFFETPDESIHVEVDAITIGEWTRLVRVLPGQAARRTHGEISSLEENDGLEGIIHVVDFGYVAPRDQVHVQSLIEADGVDTLEKLREQNLRAELMDFSALSSAIMRMKARGSAPKWLVIAVNKVDLFVGDQLIALRYYHPDGNGDFAREIRKLRTLLGEASFGVYVVPSCAYESDFQWNGRLVQSSLAKHKQDSVLRDFVQVLTRISERHQ